MKIGTTIRVVASIVALAFFASLCDTIAQDFKQGKAVVRAITKGTARYKDPASGVTDWTPLKVDTVLKPGAVVETDATGIVDLFLGVNGPVVRVTPGTQLALDKLTFGKVAGETVIETQLDLKAGTILGSVKKLAAASKYEVKTPVGVCGIRGTEYKISADGRVTVLKGLVRITYTLPGQAPVTVDVGEGQSFIPPTATAPHQVINTPQDQQIEDLAQIILSEKTVGVPITPTEEVKITVKPVERPEKDETRNFDSTVVPGSPGGAPSSPGSPQ